jgi:protein gp37
MGENSKIEWTDHTFNPWIGCQKVSAGCDNCYAEAMMDKRYGRVKWGPHGERIRTSPTNWQMPRKWARAARQQGSLVKIKSKAFDPRSAYRRPRVFCASLADVFDNQVPREWRRELFTLIEETPELDWLLLTKRPENIARMFPVGVWENVWLGTTCEDQYHFDKRYPLIREVRVPVHFISYEPAIGPLRLNKACPNWIICGGESGTNARLMQPQWARDLRDECESNGVAFFMKQMTKNAAIPDDLMVRQFPVLAVS